MNTTFNLKRFFLLEKYKKQETGKHLLWSAGVVLGICILCMMYDINKGMSYYTEHTQIYLVVYLHCSLPIRAKYDQAQFYPLFVAARFCF